ncbi:hypothetical protein CKA32_006707 [Geitlerinema sp. FC II]|nr:hypothetical protein CKA32_006707 [Geitlerinema sp. FC II]
MVCTRSTLSIESVTTDLINVRFFTITDLRGGVGSPLLG